MVSQLDLRILRGDEVRGPFDTAVVNDVHLGLDLKTILSMSQYE